MKNITVSIQAKTILFNVGGRLSVWQKEKTGTPYGVERVSHFLQEDEGGGIFKAFYMEDCFDPCISVVECEKWNQEGAFNKWLTACESHYKIEEGDKDYTEDDGHWTDGGDRYDIDRANELPCSVVAVFDEDLTKEQLEKICEQLKVRDQIQAEKSSKLEKSNK